MPLPADESTSSLAPNTMSLNLDCLTSIESLTYLETTEEGQ